MGPLPPGISNFFVETSDAVKIEVWTTFRPDLSYKNAAIVFHGNGETVDSMSFFSFFAKLGIPAFIFDYRGFGLSSGWPSEEGIYKDAEAVAREVMNRTKLSSDNLVLLGNSVGTGPAAYLASKIHPRALILLAPYSSIPSAVAAYPQYRFFRFILRYEFPTGRYLESLTETCLILAHGKRDGTIPFSEQAKLLAHVRPSLPKTVLQSDIAGHNDIYSFVEEEIIAATTHCLAKESHRQG